MGTSIFNLGPQHPSAHGVLRVIFETNGEFIKKASPEIGYLHRGTEKLCEYREYPKILPYFDRFDYVSTIAGEQAYALVVEKLINSNIPKYATLMRVLFVEMIRISNHLLALTTHAMDIGAITPFLWAFEEREEICNIVEIISGARLHAALVRPGGVNTIITPEVTNKIYEFINNMKFKINEVYKLLGENSIWKIRLENIGYISKKTIENYGLTGVLARGSGIRRDLRKYNPYDNYNLMSFRVCSSYKGDSFARFLIRVEEMYESLGIIEQALELLISYHLKPELDHFIEPSVNFFKLNIPKKNKSSVMMEELIHDFYLNSNGYDILQNKTYQAIESPKGEFGITMISSNVVKNRPSRLKIKAPGFNHLQSYNKIVSGHLLTDALTVLGSLDIVLGEIDR